MKGCIREGQCGDGSPDYVASSLSLDAIESPLLAFLIAPPCLIKHIYLSQSEVKQNGECKGTPLEQRWSPKRPNGYEAHVWKPGGVAPRHVPEQQAGGFGE